MKGNKTQTTPLNFFLLKKKKKKRYPISFVKNIESFSLFLKSTWLKLPIIETHVLQGTAFGLATVAPMVNKTQREYFFNAVADLDAFFFSYTETNFSKVSRQWPSPLLLSSGPSMDFVYVVLFWGMI